MSDIICDLCMHACVMRESQVGFCRARVNIKGVNACANYGNLTSLAMDPIEKKPFARYLPGSYVLSVGSYGCNLACPFCQNSIISMGNEENTAYTHFEPEELADLVIHHEESIGIAFTYNEPLISYEYILAVAKILKPLGKKIILVSNGCIAPRVIKELIPYVDAMNIDLKGAAGFYKTELQGDVDLVRNTIAYVYDKCHLEVTTLVIPTKNDSTAFVDAEASWLASLSVEIPLHLTRYFPRYRYSIEMTPLDTLKTLQITAQKYLKYVYIGNVF